MDFDDQVSAWIEKVERRLLVAFKVAVQELDKYLTMTVHEGGRLPIKTGNLRRSRLLSTVAMPRQATSGDVQFTEQGIAEVLSGLQLGDTVYIGFQANYARRLNYGFVGVDSLGRSYNQSGFGFVEFARSKWPEAAAAGRRAAKKMD